MQQRKYDIGFLIMLGVFLAFGLVMLTSASGPLAYSTFHDPYWYIKHQLLFGLIPGALLFLFLSKTDYHRWRRLSPKMIYLSVALLVLVFVPGLAATWGTSKSWIHLGSISLQPVEIVKLLFVIYLAGLFEACGEDGASDVRRCLVPFLASLGVIAVLLMLQPELGGLLIIASIGLVMYFVAGAPWTYFLGILCAGAAGVVVLIKSAPYRAARLMTFLHPELDPQGIGYHINQAFLAVGSGGWFGLGLGHSRQKYLYLPEVAGDSIFAVISEELGFIFMLVILTLFAAFIIRMIRIAKRAPDPFGRFLAIGIAGWVFSQMLFNVGSMVGLLPLTGLPLPFVSYGGTSLAILLAAMGVMSNISSQAQPATERARR